MSTDRPSRTDGSRSATGRPTSIRPNARNDPNGRGPSDDRYAHERFDRGRITHAARSPGTIVLLGIVLVGTGLVAIPAVLLAERLSAAALVTLSTIDVGTSTVDVGPSIVPSRTDRAFLAPLGWLRNLTLVLAGLVTGIGLYVLAFAGVRAATRR